VKCAVCGRHLVRATVEVGQMNLGRKCAVRVGLLQPPVPRAGERQVVARDTKTGDLFAGLAP
jgi:hypothetical protein